MPAFSAGTRCIYKRSGEQERMHKPVRRCPLPDGVDYSRNARIYCIQTESSKGHFFAMFKNSKGGSTFKSGKVSSGASEKKEVLESLGYAFDSITKKSGWNWVAPNASSIDNQPTEAEAIADAWRDAGERTCSTMDIPGDTWERMSVKEQAELLREALSGQ